MPDEKPYMPTTDQVRHAYLDHRDFAAQLAGNGAGEADQEIADEFDRWLSAHDAQVARNTLNGLWKWHERLAEERPRFANDHAMSALFVKRYRMDNYPEESPNA